MNAVTPLGPKPSRPPQKVARPEEEREGAGFGAALSAALSPRTDAPPHAAEPEGRTAPAGGERADQAATRDPDGAVAQSQAAHEVPARAGANPQAAHPAQAPDAGSAPVPLLDPGALRLLALGAADPAALATARTAAARDASPPPAASGDAPPRPETLPPPIQAAGQSPGGLSERAAGGARRGRGDAEAKLPAPQAAAPGPPRGAQGGGPIATALASGPASSYAALQEAAQAAAQAAPATAAAATAAQAARAAAPAASHVTVHFAGEGGAEGSLRVALRGQTLQATILAPDRESAQRLGADLGDLHRALSERGFPGARISIQQAARGEAADAPRPGREEARQSPEDRGREPHGRGEDARDAEGERPQRRPRNPRGER
jgi:hypothetical protein